MRLPDARRPSARSARRTAALARALFARRGPFARALAARTVLAMTFVAPVLLVNVLPAPARAAEPLAIGRPLPDFQATSLQGDALSLRDLAGRHDAVVLVFLSTACPYANYFAGHVKELGDRYGPRGALLVGFYSNRWESREEAAAHGRERGFAFPLVKDEGGAIARLLGATATPQAFVVDGAGRLRYRGRVMSKQEAPELERALEAVLEGREVRTPVTKAFGCSIDP